MATRREFLVNGSRSAALLGAFGAAPKETNQPANTVLPKDAPDASGLLDLSHSDLRPYYERFQADRELLGRYYPVAFAPEARAHMRTFYTEWQTQLASVPFEPLNQNGRIDHILLRYHLSHGLALLDQETAFQTQVDVFLPFAAEILALEDARRDMEPIDGKASAAALAKLTTDVQGMQARVEGEYAGKAPAEPSATAAGGAPLRNREAANTAVQQLLALKGTLHTWYVFYDGYNPDFTWWAEVPYKNADEALTAYHTLLTVRVLGLPAPPSGAKSAEGSSDPDENAYEASIATARPGSIKDIIGHPIGEAGLKAELENSMIPYTPQQLIELANREFAWCEGQMREASRAMGFGDDWHKALEKVKNDYVAPGEQPVLVVKLLNEAEAFLDKHDLITVPELARHTWRRRMIPPAQQLVSPFFLGGEVMQISYPTNTMTYEQRISTMRANNINMSRATVFHELIPGHELQLFMLERHRAYRHALGDNPFLIEGWALYWEMLTYQLGFDVAPEQRVGALDWRMHRCARIIFSLSFHLGRWTPQQCVDFLIARVGFEPSAAAGEVRRSFGGAYSPLYQAAYLLGGLQLRALHAELVPSKMTNREFHDAVLRENEIPIEMIRASLTKQPLTADFQTSWQFYGPLPAST